MSHEQLLEHLLRGRPTAWVLSHILPLETEDLAVPDLVQELLRADTGLAVREIPVDSDHRVIQM